MSNRKYVIAAISFLVVVSCFATYEFFHDQTIEGEISGVSQRSILPSELNVGSIPANFNLNFTLPANNTTKQAIRLTFASADCGCIASRDGIVLAPGQSGSLKLSLSTAGKIGPITRTVVYTVSGVGPPREIKVKLGAIVVDPLVKPPTVHLGDLKKGITKTASFSVNNFSGWPCTEVEQVSGPNQASISKVVSSDTDHSSQLSIIVETPQQSADDLTWTFKTIHRSTVSSELGFSTFAITGVLKNNVFKQNSLYLGILKKHEGLTISRDFELLDKNFDYSYLRLSTTGDFLDKTLLVGPGEGIGTARITVSVPANAREGIHSFSLDNDLDKSSARVSIPVKLMIFN